ncbi:MAG: MarR family transcriptional regulator [Lachnospiraceae bacterium]|nr:MarR family transcriptional regulator [Lachnospiraceae bacterium]
MKKEREKHCRPEPKTIEERLDLRLHQCGHYLYHHTAGPRQIMVLQLLQKNGSMSQQDIQNALNIQPGSVSELISKLESKGFLLRQRDETDRRRVVLSLTDRGMALEAKPQEEIFQERYGVLEEEEQEKLAEMLEKLLTSWDAECIPHEKKSEAAQPGDTTGGNNQ